ncbi:DUF4376 domain-containing protein [Aurantimonas aggregata]|uniref:DUF4376 domain-containing protein n=1 Tax=Aurantimonas aggregata TaxID=2047720 RepID=A0A6L9MME7_9HYPH|nr:DUF4376 domain-containing protein [Aurantimonas aggregata]NDV88806.1 DUF4376 domain-containing protein [Aurantimonas aggregata]
MKIAYVVNDMIVDFLVPPEGFALEDSFHADIIAASEEVPDEARQGWTRLDGLFVPPAAASDELSPEAALAHAADRRWRTETAGTVWNGWDLPTDERSQAKYMAELQAVGLDVRDDPSPWKFPHGFELVTNAQVQEMAVAARLHVLACFQREGEVQAAIVSGAVVTAAAIDDAFADVMAPWQPDAPSGD